MPHQDKKDGIPQEQLGTELRKFFGHVMSHDEEGVHAAICMVANAVPDEDDHPDEIDGVPVRPMHICNLNAGDPDTLAQMLVMAIDTMMEEIPDFNKAWSAALRARAIRGMISTVVEALEKRVEEIKADKCMEAAKLEVDALIERLKGNPGVMPGPDTKQ